MKQGLRKRLCGKGVIFVLHTQEMIKILSMVWERRENSTYMYEEIYKQVDQILVIIHDSQNNNVWLIN